MIFCSQFYVNSSYLQPVFIWLFIIIIVIGTLLMIKAKEREKFLSIVGNGVQQCVSRYQVWLFAFVLFHQSNYL